MTEQEERVAVLDGKVHLASQADTELACIATSLERLQCWSGNNFLSDGDSDSGVLKVTGKEFRANIDAALEAVVKALGAVRVVKAVRKSIADRVRNMTEEEFYQ